MFSSKKDICNVMVQFLYLEMNYSNLDKSKRGKANNIEMTEAPIYVTMVAKRGNQQRFESEKMEHSQLKTSDKQAMALNIKKYKNLRGNIQQNNRGTEIKGALDSKIEDIMARSTQSSEIKAANKRNRSSSNSASSVFISK